jgi:hypothetical protein
MRMRAGIHESLAVGVHLRVTVTQWQGMLVALGMVLFVVGNGKAVSVDSLSFSPAATSSVIGAGRVGR